jgi:hypothetical protein
VFVTSKKQTIVAKSSKEAEMIAVSDHTREQIAQNECYINQYGSNQLAISSFGCRSTIRLLRNGKNSSDGTKIRYFWSKDRVECKDVLVEYMPTEDMIANILTKSLRRDHCVGLKELTMDLS